MEHYINAKKQLVKYQKYRDSIDDPDTDEMCCQTIEVFEPQKYDADHVSIKIHGDGSIGFCPEGSKTSHINIHPEGFKQICEWFLGRRNKNGKIWKSCDGDKERP